MSPARAPASSPAEPTGSPSPVSATRSTFRRTPGRGPRAPRSASSAPDGRNTATRADRPPDPILFQQFFKSVGPRTYAAQIKTAGNGNPYLVLTEGKRDDATGEVRKTRLFVFSEDFDAFLSLLRDTAQWLRAHPVPSDIREKRRKFWAKRASSTDAGRDVKSTPASPPLSPSRGPTTSTTRTVTADVALRRSTPRPDAGRARSTTTTTIGGRFAAAHPPLVARPA